MSTRWCSSSLYSVTDVAGTALDRNRLTECIGGLAANVVRTVPPWYGHVAEILIQVWQQNSELVVVGWSGTSEDRLEYCAIVQSTDDKCVHQLLHDLAVDMLPNLAETAQLNVATIVDMLNMLASTNTPRSCMTVYGLMMSHPTDKLYCSAISMVMQWLRHEVVCSAFRCSPSRNFSASYQHTYLCHQAVSLGFKWFCHQKCHLFFKKCRF